MTLRNILPSLNKFNLLSPKTVSLGVALTLLASFLTSLQYGRIPTGFVKTLVPTLSDVELYLAIFNETRIARVVVNPILVDLFGFYSADVIVAIWAMVVSGLLTFAMFSLIRHAVSFNANFFNSSSRITVVSALGALLFIAFFDEFIFAVGTAIAILRSTNLETISLLGLSGYFDTVLSFIGELLVIADIGRVGGVLDRFPHPGSYLALFIFGVFAAERLAALGASRGP